jgi:ornithine lipid ester-linked acyl 2-hydroxylase
MATARATTTNLGMASKAASGRRPSRGTTAVHQALQFIRRIAILQLRGIAEFCVTPRRFSLVETTPFIDPRQFEWHELATSEWTKVQSELKAVLSAVDKIPSFQEISEDQKVITDDDKWRTYIFYVYGQRFEKHCRECPETAHLLQKIPGMKTAFFSILSPGKRIPPHRGPYRGVMRYHLPLVVPQDGQCGIRVGDQTATWEEGVGIMFDDTYEHEAWNDTKETRVVLFLDIMRPMKFPFSIINSAAITIVGWSPIVRKMRKKQAAWDRAIENHI